MPQDLFVPMVITVEQVLFYLQSELPHPTYDHGLIIDEMLADLFLGFQFRYQDQYGPRAQLLQAGVFLDYLPDHLDGVLSHASTILNHVLVTFWPDFVPASMPSTNHEQGTPYRYNGGTDLLIYMPYVEEKHPHVPRNILVPRCAITNSSFGRSI